MQLFSGLVSSSRNRNRRVRKSTTKARGWLPTVENLEDRMTPSTVSSIAASFNGTAIPTGDTVWFNAAFTASGLPKGATVTVHVDNGAIDFSANGTAYHVPVPNGVIVLTPGATSASVSFDPNDNDWDVSAPTSGAGDVFMGGVAWPVQSNLPGGIKNVTWSAAFWIDMAGVTVNWKWAASVYSSFGSDYNALSIKPVDNKDLSAYHNGHQSGTPEAFTASVIGGATGGGGSNYTGNFTGAKAVKPSVGDGMQDYPFASDNPLTSIAFNESSVLKAAKLDVANGTFEVWYSDEHALALGVRQVNVKTSSGTATTTYPVTALTSTPGSALNANVGSTATSGDQAGTDLSGRPMYPSLFITDTTTNPNSRIGDWQYGGKAIAPGAVFGTWKGVVRTVDYTTGTPAVAVTCDVDPVKNNWNLGAGSDAPPAGTASEGYGAEVRWNLSDLQAQGLLIPGHTYRFYIIVHDGDQNKSGGDCGQASFTYSYPGVAPQVATLSGLVFNYNLNAPVNGALITLLDVNGNIVATTTTGPDGTYSFTVTQAGTYSVLGPVSYLGQEGTDNGNNDGTAVDNLISGIALALGDNAINYNFSIVAPPA